MDPRFAALYLAGTAALLAGTAIATGTLAAFLGSPLTLGIAVVALSVWREVTLRTPRRVVAAGAVAVVAGLVLALVGPAGAGLATAVAGVGAVLCGTQLSLSFDPPLAGHVPSRLDARLNVGVAADEMLALSWEVVSRASRRGDLRGVAGEVLGAAQRNAERGWLERPEEAHPAPPTLEKPTLGARELRGVGPLEHLTFTSEYEPHDPEVHAQYLAVERNRTAHVYLWRHGRAPRPTLLCIHGYGGGRVAFDWRVFGVPRLHRELGLDVALVVLPLHGPRSMLRRSGAGFLDGHPLWTNAAFTQAIWDLRRLCGWLRAEGAPALGVHGVSLGGYTAALFASLEPGLACAIASIPVTDLAALTWRGMSRDERHAAEAAGLHQETLEQAWAIHCPLRHTPQVAPEARLIVAGAGDRIVPPSQPEALHEHWERPAIHWFPGTHLVWVDRRRIRERIEAHLRATLLDGTATDAPPLSRFR